MGSAGALKNAKGPGVFGRGPGILGTGLVRY